MAETRRGARPGQKRPASTVRERSPGAPRAAFAPGRPKEGGEPGTLRLFVAIELEPAMLEELARVQTEMRAVMPALRYVRPEGIHCTLKFLGDVEADRLPAIQRALSALDPPPAPDELRIGRLGTFDGSAGARVVWCAVGGDLRGLAGAATAIDGALAAVGFAAERRPFTPHLTLARVPDRMSRDERAEIASGVGSLPQPRPASMRPRGFSLMSSRLQPGGSVHTRVAAYDFRAQEH